MNKLAEKIKKLSIEKQDYVFNLPTHLAKAKEFNKFERALTDFEFIDIKAANNLVQGLLQDYAITRKVWPDESGQSEIEKNHFRIKQYVEQLIAYSQNPDLETFPKALSTKNKHISKPNADRSQTFIQMEKIRAWERFVSKHTDALEKQITSTFQMAYNSFGSGPVAEIMGKYLTDNAPELCWLHLMNRPKYMPDHDLVRILESSEEVVTAVALSASGKVAISGGYSGAIYLWNTESGELIKTMKGHSGNISAIAITPDAKLIFSAGEDKTIRVWNRNENRCTGILEGHTEIIRSIAITPDGRRVVSAGNDDKVKIWDVETGQCTNTISNRAVSALAITVDARRAFLGRPVGGSISVWDIEKNRHIVDLEGHTSSICSIAVTPDGQKLVSASYDKTLRVWDTEASKCIGILEGHTAWVSSVSITPDGRIAVSVSGDGTLRVWDINSKKCLKILQGHMTIINSVAVSVDSRVALAGGHAGGIRVWNLLGSDASEELSKRDILKVDPSLNRIIFRASDDSIHFLNSENNEGQKVLASPEKKLVATYPFTVTSDFKLGISVHDGGRLSIWNMDNQCCLKVIDCGSEDIALIKTMPLKHQVLVIGKDKVIEVWNIETGENLRGYKIKEDFDARFLTTTPDGREVVFADKKNMIVFFDLETGDIPKVLCGHSEYVGNAVVSHDGTRLISESFDKTLRVWDINNQDCIYAIKKKPGVNILAVGPDNRRLFFDDGFLVCILDLDTGDHVKTLRGHTHFILSLLITPDSKFAITGSKDNTLRVWDALESDCLAVHLSDTGITRADFVAWPYIIADTGTRNPAWIKIENAMSIDSPIVTGLRPWVFGSEDKQGHWERDLTAICYWCGKSFSITENMLGQEISCPDKECGKILKLNPFVCDRQKLY